MAEQLAPQVSHLLSSSQKVSLRGLAAFFLRLGCTAFGGPAAHIAMMEDELVRRRQWLSRQKFLDLLGASNLIPGPSSSELAIHIGYLLAGWTGLLVAGMCFILPAAIMVAALAWAYVRFSKLPAISAILYGVKPVVIAVILQALWGLGRTAVKTTFLGVVGVVCVLLAFLGLHPLLVLTLGGCAVCLMSLGTSRSKFSAIPLATAPAAALAGAATSFSLSTLFLVFLKIGAIVFGSGYVLLAFLRTAWSRIAVGSQTRSSLMRWRWDRSLRGRFLRLPLLSGTFWAECAARSLRQREFSCLHLFLSRSAGRWCRAFGNLELPVLFSMA
jgi:chromate transporter